MGKGSRAKAERQLAREQEKRSQKLSQLKSFQKVNPLTAGWMFNKWYEKIILFILMIAGFWKLFEVIVL